MKNDQVLSQFLGTLAVAESHSQLDSHLSIINRVPQHMRIRQCIIFSKKDLTKVLLTSGKYSPVIKLINEKIPAFNVKYSYSNKNRIIDGVIAILPSQKQNFYRLTTVSYGEFWRKAVRKIIHGLYPDGMPVFFKQDEMKDALINFEDSLGSKYQVKICEATLKEQREKDNHSKKRNFDTHRYWTFQPIKEVFELANENNEWFKSIKVKVYYHRSHSRNSSEVGVIRIYKNGEINFDFLYSEIRDSLINILEQHASNRFNLFSNRGAIENNYQKIKPLEIKYHTDIFQNLNEIHRFNNIIKKYPFSTKAVYHANPYYHVGIADFKDGSSFELWILSDSKIIIIPQARSSEQSLERLVSYISFSFLEGKVSDLNV